LTNVSLGADSTARQKASVSQKGRRTHRRGEESRREVDREIERHRETEIEIERQRDRERQTEADRGNQAWVYLGCESQTVAQDCSTWCIPMPLIADGGSPDTR
jgi:hypothetical protein